MINECYKIIHDYRRMQTDNTITPESRNTIRQLDKQINSRRSPWKSKHQKQSLATEASISDELFLELHDS